jgi:hypothetical protein
MHRFDVATGTLALPAWAAGAAAALFLVILVAAVLAFARSDWGRASGLLVRFALVILGAAILWIFFDRAELRERTAERRALDQRAAELAMRAMAPGSALACLDATAGDTVETACEKAVFATPEAAAAAVSYVSARLALLADADQFAKHTDPSYESALATLRQPIEADRFGIVAHVLSVRDSCTPLLCDSFALLHEASRVQANLKERVFDGYVARYTAEWAAHTQKPAMPMAEGANNLTTASVPPSPAPAPASVVSPKYDFPSAASIPPVSIMTPEPAGPPEAKQAATPPASAPLPPRRPTTPRPPAPAAAARATAPPPPQTIVPPVPTPPDR